MRKLTLLNCISAMIHVVGGFTVITQASGEYAAITRTASEYTCIRSCNRRYRLAAITRTAIACVADKYAAEVHSADAAGREEI